MRIVVAVRCYNEEKNIERFLRCYSFADKIIVSDGGSTDSSLDILSKLSDKVEVIHFNQQETVHGMTWNPDAPHMNFVLDAAYRENPDWIIFDDMDDVPNNSLQANARSIFETCDKDQVNAFRLYMWGDTEYFPYMNRDFDPLYRSIWAWRPSLNVRADETVRHGTLINLSSDYYEVELPNCLLHKSWNPETITTKVYRYNKLGLPMNHPLEFAGTPQKLPDWAVE